MRSRRGSGVAWGLVLVTSWASAGPADQPVIRVNQQNGTAVLTPRFVRSAVAIDDDGGFAAVWADEDRKGVARGQYARRFDSHGRPACDDIPLALGTGAWEEITVGSAAAGRFVTVWCARAQVDGARGGVLYQVFDPRGRPLSDPRRPIAFAGDYQRQASVAMARDGHFVVAWWGDTTTKFSDPAISVRMFDPSGEPLTGDIRVTAPYDRTPADPVLAIGDDGSFAVVFAAGPQGGGESTFLQWFDPSGQPVAATVRVNASLAGPQREASVVLRHDRTAVVAWDGLDAQTFDNSILVRVFSPDGEPITGEIRVDSHDAMMVASPMVAAAADGTFAVAWSTHADTFSSRVLMRRFKADGTPAGPARDVCPELPGHHSGPSFAGNRRGDLVVLWNTIYDGGSESPSFEIHARVFPAGS